MGREKLLGNGFVSIKRGVREAVRQGIFLDGICPHDSPSNQRLALCTLLRPSSCRGKDPGDNPGSCNVQLLAQPERPLSRSMHTVCKKIA